VVEVLKGNFRDLKVRGPNKGQRKGIKGGKGRVKNYVIEDK